MNNFFTKFLSFFIFPLIFFSCATTSSIKVQKEQEEKFDTITLLFAGDLMAHKPNYNMKDFNKIYESIKEPIQKADFSFTNIEAPVSDDLPWSTYPDFNMHSEYPLAAINAGFNVFSIINNHTNDQGLKGIQDTIAFAKKTETQFQKSSRPVYFNGLNEVSGSPISYKVIKKENWTILFIAVTEVLNRPSYRSYMNYVTASTSGWNEFISYIEPLKKECNADLFILSIHTDEPEYIRPVQKKRKEYYYKLASLGVDVIWTNHPHIVRESEIIGNEETKILTNAIIYGNGNMISAQRWEPDFANPKNPRDDTGDGMIYEIQFKKNLTSQNIEISNTKRYFITTYINTAWEFILKFLDDSFVNYLSEIGRKTWAQYIQQRKIITEQNKETILWQ